MRKDPPCGRTGMGNLTSCPWDRVGGKCCSVDRRCRKTIEDEPDKRAFLASRDLPEKGGSVEERTVFRKSPQKHIIRGKKNYGIF